MAVSIMVARKSGKLYLIKEIIKKVEHWTFIYMSMLHFFITFSSKNFPNHLLEDNLYLLT